MSCDELSDRLAERALSPGTTDGELEAHLASCAACRERAAVLDGALRRLPAIVSREAQPLSAGLRAKILEGPARPRWGRIISVGALLAAGLSVAALLAPTAPTPAVPVFHAPPEPATVADGTQGSHAREDVDRTRFADNSVASVTSSTPAPVAMEDTAQVVAAVKLKEEALAAANLGAITSDQCSYLVNVLDVATQNATAAIASSQLANARRQLIEFRLSNERDRLMKNAQELENQQDHKPELEDQTKAGTRMAK